jgi:2-polyprenyl-3-methyl-5-hydroxy-6-metoxy-1,4-benzoquinol methylase
MDKNQNQHSKLILFSKHSTSLCRKLERLIHQFKQGKVVIVIPQLVKLLGKHPNNVDILHLLGYMFLHNNQLEKAGEYLQQAYQLAPKNDVVIFNFAKVLYHIRQYQSVVQLLSPLCVNASSNEVEQLRYLAYSLRHLDKMADAYQVFCQYQKLSPSKVNQVEISQCLKNIRVNKFDSALEQQLLGLYKLDYIDFHNLIPVTYSLLQHKYQISDFNLSVPLSSLNSDMLFMTMLECSTINVLPLEPWLIRVRKDLLNAFIQDKNKCCYSSLTVSVSIQNFFNEYIFPISEDEQVLLSEIDDGASGTDNAIDIVLIKSMYQRSSTVMSPKQYSRFENTCSKDFKKLWKITCLEPELEHSLSQGIRTLLPISDEVSKRVQNQYEENPYPRWQTLSYIKPHLFKEYIKTILPEFRVPELFNKKPLNILIAGSGTGLQPLGFSSACQNSKVLAIDLSKASLGYSKRMADKLSVNNIEFLQADINHLASLNRKFEIIECCGVLHHMDDPLQGLKVLSELLVPKGIMKVALYSAIARKEISQLKQYIQAENIDCDLASIRSFRGKLFSGKLPIQLKNFADSSDLMSTSGCRDLFFHEQEHQMSIPWIEEALSTLKLKFLGFDYATINPNCLQRFIQCNDKASDKLSLEKWHQFEQLNPATFSRMYTFWCCKA